MRRADRRSGALPVDNQALRMDMLDNPTGLPTCPRYGAWLTTGARPSGLTRLRLAKQPEMKFLENRIRGQGLPLPLPNRSRGPATAFSGRRGAQPLGVWGVQPPCQGAALGGGRDALGGSMRPPWGALKRKEGRAL